jgi:Fe2+ transport system protein FeoA
MTPPDPAIPLSALHPGEHGIIQSVQNSDPSVHKRLLEFGMTAGSRVEFVRSAPLGDPIEITVKNYRLSLRRLDADSVIVRRDV